MKNKSMMDLTIQRITYKVTLTRMNCFSLHKTPKS